MALIKEKERKQLNAIFEALRNQVRIITFTQKIGTSFRNSK